MAEVLRLSVDNGRHETREARRAELLDRLGVSRTVKRDGVVTLDRITFDVRGMVSRSDARLLQRRLGQLEGVLSVRVRFEDEVCAVTTIAGLVDAAELRFLIAEQGFAARLRAEPVRTAAQLRDRGHRVLARRALLTAIPTLVVVLAATLTRLGYLGDASFWSALLVPQLFVTTGVMWVGRSLFRDAVLLHRGGGARALPIALAAAVAYGTSLVMFFGDGDPMSDVAASIVAGYHVAAWLQSWLQRRAEHHFHALATLQPTWATVRRSGQHFRIRIHDLVREDRVVVREGELVPVDGRVVEGTATLDESVVFGRGEGGERATGDRVWAGTRNTAGELLIQSTATGHKTVLGRLMKVIDDARATRAPAQLRGDRLAAWMAPVALALAIGTFVVLRVTGPDMFWLALLPALSVLIITTPWALGWASSVPVSAAMTGAARRGVLFHDAAVVEGIRKLEVLIFQKSGFLTLAQPTVQDATFYGDLAQGDSIAHLTAMMAAARDPLAPAWTAWAEESAGAQSDAAPSPPRLSGVRKIPGGGAIARAERGEVIVGTAGLLEAKGVACPPEPEEAEGAFVYLAIGGALASRVRVTDGLREDAQSTLQYASSLGIHPMLVDEGPERDACQTANQLGIPNDDVRAGLDASAQSEVVRALRAADYRVGMAADFATGAPALAAAHVAFALSTDRRIPEAHYEVVLLRPGSGGAVIAVDMARRAFARMRQNLATSGLVMLFGIPAAMGYLPPHGAVLCLLLSILLTGVNGLRGLEAGG